MDRNDIVACIEFAELIVAACCFGIWCHSVAAGWFLFALGLMTWNKWGR